MLSLIKNERQMATKTQENYQEIYLCDLNKFEQAEIINIIPNPQFASLDASVTQRLQDLGFIQGQEIEIIAYSFLGKDPIAVRMGNSQFALRLAEAKKIAVKRK